MDGKTHCHMTVWMAGPSQKMVRIKLGYGFGKNTRIKRGTFMKIKRGTYMKIKRGKDWAILCAN